MKCKTSNWSCSYHACMSDDCQKEEVLNYHPGFGPGECEIEYCTCEMPAKMHGKNQCWRCKKPFKELQKQTV